MNKLNKKDTVILLNRLQFYEHLFLTLGFVYIQEVVNVQSFINSTKLTKINISKLKKEKKIKFGNSDLYIEHHFSKVGFKISIF